ncbi:MAG: ribonuclease III [Candidatus Neomarinimicrobiota bacterium]|nr:MAG: ribonuclease III [Candidatus Neomarinimicrobiota bacterium]
MGWFHHFIRSFSSSAPDPFAPLQEQIGYRFRNRQLLEQAFTHRSCDPNPRLNYERLEFLGDAVIDAIISKWLMEEYPQGDEGMLTQKRSSLVQKSYLANMGKLLNLLDYIRIEDSVNLKIDKIATKQLANLFESLLGALYLDGGYAVCERVLRQTIWSYRHEAFHSSNYKGHLIEYCHSHSLESPHFIVAKVSGPDHQRTFEVFVKIGSRSFRPGVGSNKKAAEQSAAQIALEELSA